MNTPLLSAENLAIMRGERMLFREISLTVSAGNSVILRGANGAGKTTLLRILAGLTRPDTGKVFRNVPHHWIGHTNGIKPDETPLLHLQRWAQAWGVERPGSSHSSLHSFVRAPIDIPVRLLSAGQKRRTALARLQLDHRPLWLLDEPFTALDGDGRAMMLEQIAAHRESGGAVIAAIHGDTGFEASGEIEL